MSIIKYVNKNCQTSADSYSATNAIARHCKPFLEEEFLNEAWLACASSLFDDFDNKDKIIQRIKEIPLSRNTIKDRILKLAENVTDEQNKDINSSPFVSPCLDEKYIPHDHHHRGRRHSRRVTNPATAECNMSGCMEDTSLWIASFSFDRLDGPDRYTRDYKYPHNQKSAGVKS
ncbi:general transcription factor II-I repeat domain-containing protein 2A [Trichonephila clavipes]|nr:general transcription factor II-I repeat domain-containing protein 2A [Trichonephila clavipes]